MLGLRHAFATRFCDTLILRATRPWPNDDHDRKMHQTGEAYVNKDMAITTAQV